MTTDRTSPSATATKSSLERTVEAARQLLRDAHKYQQPGMAEYVIGPSLEYAQALVELADSISVASHERLKGEFTVGAYTLSAGRENGKVWIEHETGEGGDFTAANVEAAIAAYYKENF